MCPGPPVMAPFVHVAGHVMESPGICSFLSYRFGGLGIVTVPPDITRIGVRRIARRAESLVVDSVVVGSLGPSAIGILPFSLGG